MTHGTAVSAVTSPSARADGSFAEKIEALVDRSGGQIQADVAHA
jgi:hypothetical protein